MCTRTLCVFALTFSTLLRLCAADSLLITEFMASNSSTLRDEDNAYPDWIEIYNAGTNTVNLNGWYLTDSAGNLTKWQFPATNMASHSFMVVFASGKNRRVPGRELHTSFNLSASGEYLALVMPDGVTVASEYAPAYPGQAPDVSYGLGAITTNVTVIGSNTLVRVRIPNGTEGPDWQTLNYDDAAWISGTNGVGYGATNTVEADYSLAVLPTAPVAYYRLDESSGTTALNLGSGGAAQNGAYTSVTLGTAGPRPPTFNGFELNNNAPTFNGSSSFMAGPVGLLSGRASYTLAGWIKPAGAQAARTGLFGQNDAVEFGFIDANTIQLWTPSGSANAAYTVPANTWVHLAGVGDGTNIRIYTNGVLAASGAGTTSGSSTFGFNIGGGGIFDPSANFFNGQIDEVAVYHRALSLTEIQSLYRAGTNGVGGSSASFVRTDVGPAMSNVNASAYIRIPFTVTNPTNVTQLTLRMRYDDGFVAFINGAEVARVNAPDPLAFNSNATNTHSPLALDEFRLGGSALVAGNNVLAIQGLNLAANDGDFLVAAELILTSELGAGPVPLYFTAPTPGAPNDGGIANPGPAILEPTYSPTVPKDDQDLIVTTRIEPTFFPLSSVVMRYRVMFNPEIEVPMFDDGGHGDGAPNDGIFGAAIPASAATNGQMIRWYFRATDTLNHTSRWPVFVNQLNSPEYLGTIVDPTNVTSLLPIFHLFISPQNLSGVDTESGGRASFFYDGEFYDNIYMEVRGNTSASQVKKSHRLEFNREHTFRHLPEFPRVRKTSLMAEFLDPTYLRQHLSFWLLEQMGVTPPFFYPVRAQLNGSFYGLTFHSDVIDIEQVQRMGYDPAGALYKAAGNCLPSESSTGVFQKKSEPLADHTDYQTLVRAINETNFPPGQPTNLDLRRAAAFDMLDIPEVVNYLAGARWCGENDDVWANMSLYRDTYGDGLWRIIPFDMNASWGQRYGGITPLDAINDGCKSHPLYGGSTTIACDGNSYNRMYDTIIALPETRQMLLRRERTILDRWVFEQGVAPESRLLETHIRYMTNLIWTEAFLDRAKWGYSTWTASNKPLNVGADELFNEFIDLRRIHFSVTHNITNVAKPLGIAKTSNAGIPQSQPANLPLQIVSLDFNPSSGNQAQEYIALANPNPIALDISGWKLSGAVTFTFKQGTVVPSNSVFYVSPDFVGFRSRTSGPRGGQGLFVVGPYKGQLSAQGEKIVVTDEAGQIVASQDYAGAPSLPQQYLRITEIMYHPGPTNAGSLFAQEEFEYLELKNISSNAAVSLLGVHFTNGIDYAFTTNSAVTNLAPGQVIVLVKNPAAFVARYGGSATIAGTFAGSLDNSGERIQLHDAVGEQILDFSYNNSWYPITDGLGFSLVIQNENAPWNTWGDKASWRASGSLNGSPGLNEPPPPVFVPVLVNEVLANSDLPAVDAIELWNPSSTPADVGNWWITDDVFTPQKFRIPASTIIPAGGYRVFTEAEFNPGGVGFSFSSHGDEAYLYSGDAGGNLTGYFHGFGFDASAPGVSFGRYLTSDGDEHFVAQRALTLTNANSGPKVGPVVVSEIMYHPPNLVSGDDTDDEFIELHNISSNSVSLFDTTYPTNRWRLDNAVHFSFSTNTTMMPGSFLIVVGFDPNTNGAALAAFRAKYGVGAGVAIVGPWNGKLDNSEDTVDLKMPDTSVPTNIASVLVERVHYHDTAPWPAAADGFGPSLIRIVEADFGNDATNWLAGAPTPGTASSIAPPPVITAQPVGATVLAGVSTNLTVSASGNNLTFQWFHNGSLIPGATGPSLSLSDIQLLDAGTYNVVALSGGGATLSSNAQLTVLLPVTITAQPLSQGVQPGADVTLSVGVIGNGTLRYQWRFEGTDLPNATNATYTITNANLAEDHGNFSVAVSDDVSSTVSSNAFIFVLVRPGIVMQPVGVTNLQWQSATFSVIATGAPPLSYRWIRQGVNFLSNAPPTLVIASLQPSNAGSFRVVITNLAGSVNSATVPLAVIADTDADGLPDFWEMNYTGSTTNMSATADPDGDGMINRDEYVAGTDPLDPLSVLKLTLTTTNTAVLQFVAQTNIGYSLQYRTNLNSAVWNSFTSIAAQSLVQTVRVGVPKPPPDVARFYRVVTPPQP